MTTKNTAYSADVINHHTGFFGKFELELCLITSGAIDIGSFIVIKDANYKALIRTQYFKSFSQARACFLFLLENEAMLTDVNDIHELFNDFYKNRNY